MLVNSLSLKLASGVLGLGTVGAASYGIYELARVKTMRETLLKNNFTVLDVNNTNDDSRWEQLVTKHNDSASSGQQPAISKLTFPSGTTVNKEKLKEKCGSLLISFYKDENQQEYKDAKNWCTTFQIPS